VAVVGRLVQKWEREELYTKGETIHKTIQKYRVNKIGNIQNKKTNIKTNIKKHQSSNYKITNRGK
jgi:hypothetical protein